MPLIHSYIKISIFDDIIVMSQELWCEKLSLFEVFFWWHLGYAKKCEFVDGWVCSQASVSMQNASDRNRIKGERKIIMLGYNYSFSLFIHLFSHFGSNEFKPSTNTEMVI